MKTLILKTSLVLLPLCLAAPAWAQMSGSDSPSNAPSSSDTSAAPEVAHADRSFALHLAMASTNEVALSQLADSHAASPDVKSFAAMMIRDHEKLNSQLADLASRRGIDISAAVEKGQKKGVSSLESKQGGDFDQAYVKEMIKTHKQAVDLLRKEIANSHDQDFITLANQALPIVQMHLQHAEDLAQKLGVQ